MVQHLMLCSHRFVEEIELEHLSESLCSLLARILTLFDHEDEFLALLF